MKLNLVRAALVLAILSLPLLTASADPLPPAQGKECEAAKKPASCPGGGEAKYVDGEWKCHDLPRR